MQSHSESWNIFMICVYNPGFAVSAIGDTE